MGRVFLAQNGGPVALKVLHPHLIESEEARERFAREADIGRRIVHGNVVRTLDFGSAVVDGVAQHYLVMEYVEGQTLRALLEELGQVPEELCRHIARETAKGLAAIHALEVVHRDIKPENVLITKDHVVKVMDLGVARLMDEAIRLSHTGAFLGSALYAAPELFAGGEPDRRADFYALGLVLYELATGRHPFRSDSFANLLDRHLHESPRPAGELNPQLSPFYEELCNALLAKNREERLDFLPADEESSWWKERARAIQAKTKRPLRRIRIPRETALYGRDAELERLAALYESAKAGEGCVLLLEGEAGIGKTRLVDEFAARLRQEGEELAFLFGGYPPGGAATATGAFTVAFREHLGDQGSARYLEGSPALAPAFDALLRGDATPTGARPLSEDSLQACFVHATQGVAAEQTALVLVDDLHFAPREGRALFAALAHAIASHRVLLVGTMRPGLPEEWVANLLRLGHATRVALGRLGPKDLMRLLEDSLGSKRVAERLGHQIAVKSDGNPFFTFEIIRELRDERLLTRRDDGSTWVSTRALEQIRIPSSVADLIQARIADLEEAERELLDAASCCGYEFDPGLVADALGMRRIPALRRFANVERTHRLVRSAGRHMVFDHHQVQEALYGGLHDQLRAEYHAALGEALEGRDDDEDPAALCDHFLRGDLGTRALPYLTAALDQLEAAHASEATIALAQRALATAGLIEGAERVALLQRLAARLDLVGRWEDEEAVLLEARDLADAAGDAAVRCSVRRRLGLVYRSMDRYDDGLAVLAEAIELARETKDRRVFAHVTGIRGDVLRRADRYDEARQHFERHLEIAKEIGDRRGEMMASGAIGNVLAVTGNREEGGNWSRRYYEIARELGDERAQAIAAGNIGVDALHLGRFDEARTSLERSRTLSRQLGYRMGEARAHCNLAVSYESDGRLGAALEHAETFLELSQELGYARGEVLARNHLTELYLACGDAAKAGKHAGLSLETAQASKLHNLSGAAWAAAGRVAEAAVDLDRAERCYAEAVRLGRETENVEALLPSLLKQATFLVRRDRPDAAREILENAIAKARDARLPGPLALATALRATLPGGDPARALEVLEASAERLPAAAKMAARFHLWEATGDRAQLEAAHRLLLAARDHAPEPYRTPMLADVPLHRAIVDAWERLQ